MRLGVFGGTFDPPHIGHLILAAEALDQLQLDKVLWLLTPFPPHKISQSITPLLQRLQMLQAALVDEPRFELSRLDIDRPPLHYAVDTLALLRQNVPSAQLVYLMGEDFAERFACMASAKGICPRLRWIGGHASTWATGGFGIPGKYPPRDR